jgi:PAS domain S-box-containing protein
MGGCQVGLEDFTVVVTMLTTLLGFLGAVWLKVLRPAMKFIDKHDDVVQSIATIESEITCNGGASLKDAVVNLNDTCGRIESRQKIIEQRTKASLHYSSTALFETDQKGRLVWTNEPFYLMTGQTLTDIKGYDWITYVHEDEREDFLQEFESCLEMNRKFSKELTTSNGEKMRMVGYPYRLNDKEQGGFLISLSAI